MTVATERKKLKSPVLTEADAALAKAAQRLIMESLDRSRAARIRLESPDGASVTMPPNIMKVIGQMLGLLAQRQRIVLIPESDEFSTVEAAHFLNVSRPFVIQEIEAGRLACRKVGTHRRIPVQALAVYAKRMQKNQEQALDAMAQNADELGLSY